MARFDVYRHPDAKQRVTTPFLLDVQNEYISGLQTRVVLPLRRAERVAIPVSYTQLTLPTILLV